jgi:purine nucleosidase
MAIPVINDNGGHVDDLISTMFLWLNERIDLQAVTITDSDCYANQAYEAVLKIATYLGLEGAEVGYSEDQCPNPFPDNWRRESYIINELPIFGENALKKPYQTGKPRKSQALISDILSNSKAKVSIVTSAPLTNIASIFQNRPELKAKVEQLVVMGGAINVPGNVEQTDHAGEAEWNFYADAAAAKNILESGLPLVLVPLDVTSKAVITQQFLSTLDEQAETSRASKLASKLYSLVKGFNYYFWNTLNAAAMIAPELFTYKEMRLDIATSGKAPGKIVTSFFGGRKVKVATEVDVAAFNQLLLKTLGNG